MRQAQPRERAGEIALAGEIGVDDDELGLRHDAVRSLPEGCVPGGRMCGTGNERASHVIEGHGIEGTLQ